MEGAWVHRRGNLRRSNRFQLKVWMSGVLAAGLSLLLLQSQALASVEVRLGVEEFSAVKTLLKPEQNRLELNGDQGKLIPAASLRALGVSELPFSIDFTGLGEVAGLRFDRVTSLAPGFDIENGAMTITVPFNDQERALRSHLGSIHIRGVSLKANVKWRVRATGQSEPYLASIDVFGRISGTGVFRPQFMVQLVKKLLIRSVSQSVDRVLRQEGILSGVELGLKTWAKFSTGVEWHEIVPGSVNFGTGREGLVYQVQ